MDLRLFLNREERTVKSFCHHGLSHLMPTPESKSSYKLLN